jgi:hypothetical protein
MLSFESITIREVESSDREIFYEHQLDPEAIRMTAFVCKDPKDKVAFDAHWKKILNSSQNTNRTIVAEGQVAGHHHGEAATKFTLTTDFTDHTDSDLFRGIYPCNRCNPWLNLLHTEARYE